MIAMRIKKIADLIDLNLGGVYDVGSDHGYLLILLREKNKNIKLMGVENKKEPFNNLSKNVKGKNILISFSDGIDKLDESFSTIVLAGMGYKNIVEIILKHKEKLDYISQIVIDSHTNIDLCRKFFISLGFFIENEVILKEKDIFYEIISFKKGNKNYSEMELHYGPCLLKERNDVFKEKYLKRNKKIETIIPKLNCDSLEYKNFLEEYKLNNEVLK